MAQIGTLIRASNKMSKCRGCGKPCHSSIEGCQGICLCRKCFDEANLENEHNDGYHDDDQYGPQSECKQCKGAT
jgi:hypothetical protein